MRSIPQRTRQVLATWLGYLIAPLVAAGCGAELGPERFETTMVRGQILVGGEPVGGGFIEFHPVDGTRGNLRVGPILADGTFQLDRVPVGPVVIGMSQLPVGPIPSVDGLVDARQFDLYSPRYKPVQRSIPPRNPTQLPPIDLIAEAAKQRRKPFPRRKKRSGRRGLGLAERPPKPRRTRSDEGGEAASDHKVPAPQQLTIRVIYRDSGGAIHLNHPSDQIEAAIKDAGGTVWVDVEDLDSAHNGEVEVMLRDFFHFHPLAIEDALKDVHVPRIDDWGNYLYLVVNTLDFHPETDDLQLHELDLFLGSNFLLSYHHEAIEVLDRLHFSIEREPGERLKQGPSHLLHHLLDDVVAEFLPAIEHLDDAIDDAQDEVFDHATSATLRRIFQVKGAALQLHRVVIPMREVLNRLARDSYSQVRAEHQVYFRDVYDHLVRVHDIVESLRDLISGALDTYLSVVSNRTNDIMKVLTLLNVMFLPMSFIAGFFGMNFFGETLNFKWPDLPRTFMFWTTVGTMVATPVGMWVLARVRGWF